MKSRCIVTSCLLAFLLLAHAALAGDDLKSLIPFGKRVEANPNDRYQLTEEHGPWMILASTFTGATAEQEAHALVMELRTKYNLEAYLYNRTFDFTQPVIGLGINEFGNPRKMVHRQNKRVEEIAVLIGHFASPEDHDIQKVLKRIKHARPKTLEFSKERKSTAQRFAVLREIQRRISNDPEKQEMGPMRTAFVSRNPLLPADFFVTNEPDELVLQMNKNVKHSLLDCPGQYSVRVATFRGKSTMKLDEMAEAETKFASWLRVGSEPSKLEEAADNAHRLTMALRERGVPAFEFHDRFESIVTIGSFNSVGRPRADGKIEIDPAIHSIIETYRAQEIDGNAVAELRQQGAVRGLKQKRLGGIPFDIQPVPVEVPRFEEE